MLPASGENRLERQCSMRSDMHKVIVERPRLVRGRWKNLKTALRLTNQQSLQAMDAPEDYDSGPDRASSRRHEKELNENLAPLRRYLLRQVGRPWAKVYGEIRQTIDTRSAIGLHVLQHLDGYVATNTFLQDGAVYEWNWRGRPEPVRGLFVHPKSGLLRLPKPRVIPREQPPVETVRVSDDMQYQKIDGLWFRVQYRLAQPNELVTRCDGKLVRAADLGYPVTVLAGKRQCDRKTIRRIEAREAVRVRA
jgi:hypothetical protein